MTPATDMPAVSPEIAARRDALFRETPVEMLERLALGTVWAVKPNRVRGLPALARMWLSDLVRRKGELPDPESALDRPDGLCGIARDLTPDLLLEAYRRTLFTFAHYGPSKWFSPKQRCVVYFDEFHIAKRLRSIMKQKRFTVTFDRDFEGVIKACAGRRAGKWHVTWITPRIMRLYAALYDAGHVHSYEVWNAKGELAGGGYGLAMGEVFFTESQFSLEPNTSKIGFALLNWHLAKWGFVLNDNKWMTPTVEKMGFRDVPRAELQRHLTVPTARGGRWQVEADLAAVAAWQPETEHRMAAE